MGRQFPVSTSSVDVFASLEKGNGLCLSSLFEQNKRPTEATARTREKIGQGKNSSSTKLAFRGTRQFFLTSNWLVMSLMCGSIWVSPTDGGVEESFETLL